MTDRTQRRASGEGASATRQALLAAAAEVVGERGIAGATSRAIADRAGANLAALTYYFGSKDHLVAEALVADIRQRVEPAMALLEGDDPAPVRLLAAVDALLTEFERSDEDVAVYLQALVLSASPGAQAAGGREVVEALRQRLATVIDHLVRDGVIDAWVQPQPMASLLVAAANGIALQSQLQPGLDVREVVGQLASLLLSASSTHG